MRGLGLGTGTYLVIINSHLFWSKIYVWFLLFFMLFFFLFVLVFFVVVFVGFLFVCLFFHIKNRLIVQLVNEFIHTC